MSRAQLPEAALLNGANFNAARALGPAVGGALIAAVGPAATFGLNAVSFVGVMTVVAVWRRPADQRALGAEHVRSAMVAGVRYVGNAPFFKRVLGRSALFIFPASALWALLPVLARGRSGSARAATGCCWAASASARSRARSCCRASARGSARAAWSPRRRSATPQR